MKLEKEVKIIDYGLGQNNTVIELKTLSQFNDVEFIAFNEILKSKKIKLILEAEKPILDEAERRYLSGVIRPFRDEVKCIKKIEYTESEYIQIILKDFCSCCINLPFFKKGAMYKNMKSYKEYTLDDLNL